MPYIALYRKYRSQTFEDVMGQEHVTRTIQNAIEAGRIGHAYLFCGSRGTGKTTVARILAKAVNCEKGPTGHPCNECAACRAITEGSAVDVVEMDAASHRGVQDVDSLREGVKYPPMHMRYKVYIVDEAHQLSPQAKDAFLKTLEEPPDHAIFILATTEAHAIPPTIRSRCQQFDFRRGSLESISERLRYVAQNEGVTLQDEAVRLLAEAGAGSWRDALSLLEQVIAYSGETVTSDDVINVLGTVGQEILREVTNVIADRDGAAAFEVADRLVAEGKDIGQLLKSLASHFRDLLFAASGAADAASGRLDTRTLSELASRFERAELLRLIQVFSEAERDLRWNDQQRLVLEMALLKAIEEPAQTVVQGPAPAVVAPARVQEQSPRVETAPRPEPTAARPPEEPPLIETPSEAPARADGVTLHDVRKVWDQVLSVMRAGKNASACAILQEARLADLEGDVLTLAFDPKYQWHASRAQQKDITEPLEAALAKVTGARLKTKVTIKAAAAAEPAPEPESAGGSLLENVLEVIGGEVEEEDAETGVEDNPWEEN